MASFRLCLNSSTLSNQTLGIVDELAIAAAAGFDGVELWLPSIHGYVERGGRLDHVAHMASDLGVVVENGIGFAPWIVDDDADRRAGLETARRDMDALAALGCHRIAAPPMGAVSGPALPLGVIAERFDVLADIGATLGVTPQLEIWGFANSLSKLSHALDVAALRDQPTSILVDVFHLVRGGSGLDLGSLSACGIEVVHLNDLPVGIADDAVTDADRVLPGDGVAPLAGMIEQLAGLEGEIVLSLELFNRELWARDPHSVAARGLQRLRSLGNPGAR